MSPTIVLKGGKVRLVTGSPGGRTIPNTTLWVILNVLEFGMTPREAVESPRTHHQWFPDVLSLEGTSWDQATRDALKGMGHTIKVGGTQGDAHTIVVDEAGGDPWRRRPEAEDIEGGGGLISRSQAGTKARSTEVPGVNLQGGAGLRARRRSMKLDGRPVLEDRELGDDHDLVPDHVVRGFFVLFDVRFVGDPDVLADS